MDLQDFIKRFKKLKAKGFVPSRRKGPTGIEYTLEHELGIKENNIAGPDFSKIELKAHRLKSQNLITLFTFNNKVWKMPPLEAIKKYGSFDQNGRKGLYYTMSLTPNSAGLFLNVGKTNISVRHIEGTIIALWELKSLTERFTQKISSLIFVSAFSEERDGIEYFHYYRAQLMNNTSPELLGNQFKAENILVDLRLHDKGTMARNHGTGFRVYEEKLPSLFKNITEL